MGTFSSFFFFFFSVKHNDTIERIQDEIGERIREREAWTRGAISSIAGVALNTYGRLAHGCFVGLIQ